MNAVFMCHACTRSWLIKSSKDAHHMYKGTPSVYQPGLTQEGQCHQQAESNCMCHSRRLPLLACMQPNRFLCLTKRCGRKKILKINKYVSAEYRQGRIYDLQGTFHMTSRLSNVSRANRKTHVRDVHRRSKGSFSNESMVMEGDNLPHGSWDDQRQKQSK